MSSPIEQSNTLVDRRIMDTTFEKPPADITTDANDSIIVKKEEITKNNSNESSQQNQTRDVLDLQSPVLLTQQIVSDDEKEDEKDNDNNNTIFIEKLNENHAVKTVQYKGQPAWELTIGDITLVKRMDDMKYLLAAISQLIEKKSNVTQEEIEDLNKELQNSVTADENNDYWISKDLAISVLTKYSLQNTIKPLFEPIDDINNLGNNKKRSNNETHVYESPTKKYKLTLEKELDISFYDHDLIAGNPSSPFTLKPLTEDNLINENSKVIISSLFLPYQKEITLDEVLKNQNAFLNSEDQHLQHPNSSKLVDRKFSSKKSNDGTDDELDNNNEQTTSNNIIDKDQINIDVSIGDHGQTALHLAATLGNISLVKELLEQGANRFRGDDDGQTALIRAVHVTNCFELSCFDRLLDLLYPSITLLDNRGRTILHHIALTCGLKGRYDSSRYYLETLLEWVVKKGSKLPNNSTLTLSNFIGEVVNKSDKYGNTCLNYATLAGNKYIVSQLLDIGADPYKANKVGVTPGDWGIDVKNSISNSTILGNDANIIHSTYSTITNSDIEATNNNNDNNNNNNNNNNTSVAVNKAFAQNDLMHHNDKIHNETEISNNNAAQKRLDFNEFKESSSNSLQILDNIQSFISNLGKDFRQEITQKSQQIDKLNPILREKTLKLSQKRKQYDELQKLIRKISKITNKIDNLNKAINEEETKFQQEVKDLSINIDDDNCLGNFDADQPFTISNLYNDVESIVEKLLEENLKKMKDSTEDYKDFDHSNNDIEGDNDNEINESNEVSNYNVINVLKSIKPSDILPYYQQHYLTHEKMESLKKEIPPSVVLDARIQAYEKNNQILMDRMNKKRNCNKELESQFKRIVSLCIGTDTENIDDRLLSSLLMSVENDPDPEIGQIKKVLKIVGDLGGDDEEESNDNGRQ